MKKITHPKLSSTLVILNDGSVYKTKWPFFKKVLRVDMDTNKHPLWNIKKSKKSEF